MRKIVVNGVDGNFGKTVAEYVLKMIPKEELVFTAPREEKLEEYKKMGLKTATADFNSPDQLKAAKSLKTTCDNKKQNYLMTINT